MKHLAYSIVLLLLLSASALPVTAESPDFAEFRIGAILPLTGPMAFAGTEVRDAITLGLSDVGTTRHRYKVVFEDNGPGPVATAAAANKLVSQDRVNAIITLWPEAANVAAPITERNGVLHYTIAWDPDIACSRKLVLSHQVMVTDYARKTLELLKSRRVTSINFFHDSVFQQGADILSRLAGDYGINVEKIYTFDRGKTDFRTELAASRRKASQVLLIWSIMPETEIFLKQVKEQRIGGFVTGFFDVVQDLSLIEGYPFASEVFSTPTFQEKFKSHYGRMAVMKGPNAYDIVHLLVSAVEGIPEDVPSSASIKQELTKVTDFVGAVGVVSINKCGNSSYPVMIKIVKQGKLSELSEGPR